MLRPSAYEPQRGGPSHHSSAWRSYRFREGGLLVDESQLGSDLKYIPIGRKKNGESL